jgi:uncharacterized protein YjiS (DUF1127 family)
MLHGKIAREARSPRSRSGWPRSVLSEYAQRFAENDIDVTVLRHLTDQDLNEIGVSRGHRRKILASIAEFAGAAPTRSQYPPDPKPRD